MLQSSNFIIVWKSSPEVNPNILIGSYPVRFHRRSHKPYSFCSLENDLGPIFSILVTLSTRTQASVPAETLSPCARLAQLATLTFERPQKFHSARRIMRPWTLLCGAALVKNFWSRATSTTGSHARKVLVA